MMFVNILVALLAFSSPFWMVYLLIKLQDRLDKKQAEKEKKQ